MDILFWENICYQVKIIMACGVNPDMGQAFCDQYRRYISKRFQENDQLVTN